MSSIKRGWGSRGEPGATDMLLYGTSVKIQLPMRIKTDAVNLNVVNERK